MRSARPVAATRVPTPPTTATNSSPPTRATRSPGRTACSSRRATRHSSSSPHSWPYRSFTGLKRSRSTYSTANVSPSSSRRSRRSTNVARFASAVSESCRVTNSSSVRMWCRSLTSWPVTTMPALAGPSIMPARSNRSGVMPDSSISEIIATSTVSRSPPARIRANASVSKVTSSFCANDVSGRPTTSVRSWPRHRVKASLTLVITPLASSTIVIADVTSIARRNSSGSAPATCHVCSGFTAERGVTDQYRF